MGVMIEHLDGKIWFDGKFIDWDDAKIHFLTHALHYGSAVFEGDRCYNGKIFKLNEHSQRLIDSGKILDIDIPYTTQELNEACQKTCEINGLKDAYIRPIAWRGSKALGISAIENPIHVAIAAWEWPSYFTLEQKMKGLRLNIAKWRRPAPDTAPVHAKATGLYMICTSSKHASEAEGFDDALMLDYRGYIAESTGSNIFFLMDDGKIHTPLPDCFLNGITRQVAIEILQDQLNMEVVERHILPEELSQVKEAFVTGTAIEITPIREIAGYSFTPSDLCQKMIKAYDIAVGKS